MPKRFRQASLPFALVAVDGGGGYWHKRASGEDSGAMVLNELIPMLSSQGLDTSRVGFLGWSMGGYGALLLGARLGPARTAAICAVSPALWTSSGAAAPGAFDGADDYAANTVWGLPQLGSIPIRIDCGDSDPFYSATKQFIAQLPSPPSGGFSPGGHDGGFWSSQLPAEIAWMAPLVVGLEAYLAFGGGEPDVRAKVAARQANRLDKRIGGIPGGRQVLTRPDDRQHPPA